MDDYINRQSLQRVMEFVTTDCTCPLHIAAEIDQLIAQEPAANVVECDELKKLIERKYGDLDNTRGCNINGQWLSIASIVELIEQGAKNG